ncbi:hypothetical protein NDU88_008043 [Pleurodeles waltl]|uniref:Uncharacterized protein n=1 Tax=Pleurodeles waltl TaxID=8319 RepID=A0AAV7RUP1_PLEWA|nr:hypothetical protein NDU88_008043 [Pleurodeles waltl]
MLGRGSGWTSDWASGPQTSERPEGVGRPRPCNRTGAAGWRSPPRVGRHIWWKRQLKRIFRGGGCRVLDSGADPGAVAVGGRSQTVTLEDLQG